MNFNPDFWEIPATSRLDGFSTNQGLWQETEEEKAWRFAWGDFRKKVIPVVKVIIDSDLTERQRQIVILYFFMKKTQGEIAIILDISQSTVSRHLYDTNRNGKKVGGAKRKLKKIVAAGKHPAIEEALMELDSLRNVS
ncbi:MAG: hypothetical protein CMI53_04000 [Parcubacteria group bacterium]|nr:hypothetical protein [Parcubacteria group bacterium]|tara:strand:+ start:2747 stop:3160 length:414 start_codon:yes stop_codon:yes gene_type:complete